MDNVFHCLASYGDEGNRPEICRFTLVSYLYPLSKEVNKRLHLLRATACPLIYDPSIRLHLAQNQRLADFGLLAKSELKPALAMSLLQCPKIPSFCFSSNATVTRWCCAAICAERQTNLTSQDLEIHMLVFRF